MILIEARNRPDGASDPKRPAARLAELPMELVYMVTDLLEPNDIFHSRFVSRKCYRVFTAAPLLKRILVCSKEVL